MYMAVHHLLVHSFRGRDSSHLFHMCWRQLFSIDVWASSFFCPAFGFDEDATCVVFRIAEMQSSDRIGTGDGLSGRPILRQGI